MIRKIGTIENYYGCLEVKDEDGIFYWFIEDYDTSRDWESIPKYLFDALNRYEDERVKQ